MIDNTPIEELAVREVFNEMRLEKSDTGEPTDTLSLDDLDELSKMLHDQAKDRVDIYDGITELTRAEAQVWALVTHTGPDDTLLTLDGIAAAMSTPNNPFRRRQAPSPGWRVETLSRGYIERLYESASKKIEDPDCCIDYSRGRTEQIENPEPTQLGRATIRRLEARRHDHVTLDDVVTHLLNSTSTNVSLEECIRKYLDSRGANDVAQIAIDHESMKDGHLVFTAHTGHTGDLPIVITETDEIVIDDRYYGFTFEEEVSSPFHDRGQTTIYRRSNASEQDSVSVNAGVHRVHDLLSELQKERESTTSNKQ